MRTKDETKVQIILHTALKMVARVGLAGLKMSDLAKEAGVATGTVYLYFEDKNQLIYELYQHLMHHSTHDLTRSLSETDPLKVKIKKTARNYLDDTINNPEHGAFLEQYFRSPYFRKEDSTHPDEKITMQPVYQLIMEGQHQGLIKEADPAWLVTLICGMLNEVAKVAVYSQKSVSAAEWELTFGVLWDGIKS